MAPSHDLMHLGAQALEHDLMRLRHFGGRQSRLRAGWLTRDQATDAALVEAKRPVAKDLMVHDGVSRGVR